MPLTRCVLNLDAADDNSLWYGKYSAAPSSLASYKLDATTTALQLRPLSLAALCRVVSYFRVSRRRSMRAGVHLRSWRSCGALTKTNAMLSGAEQRRLVLVYSVRRIATHPAKS